MTDRSVTLLEEIKVAAKDLKTSQMKLGRLLSEVVRNQYFKVWGYNSFPAWLDSAGIGLKSQTAMRLVAIAEKSVIINANPAQLEKVGISKLQYIFELNPEKHKTAMKDLLRTAKDISTDEMRQAVYKIAGRSLTSSVYISFGVSPNGKLAVEKALTLAGNARRNSKGEAFEEICNFYLKHAPKMAKAKAA